MKRSAFFPRVERWEIPRSAWRLSFIEMGCDGTKGNEGVALWLGQQAGAIVTVTHVVVVREFKAARRPQFVHVSADVMNAITDLTIEYGARLVGHIHSHPGIGTGLSSIDEQYGIQVPYYLSVVVPYFGLRPDIPIWKCGFHVYEPASGYRRFSVNEIGNRIRISEDGQVSLLQVRKEMKHGYPRKP